MIDALSNDYLTNANTDPTSIHCTSHGRILNKRLARIILYGRKAEDLIDRRTILQRCVEEIGRVRDNDKSELGTYYIISIGTF